VARAGQVLENSRTGERLQLAVIGREFAEEGRATCPPAAVQRITLAPLAALGRLLGYRGIYARYSGGA
jgi:hypothetical protein